MSSDTFPAHESTRKRRRWGCTCGCGFILIFLIIGGALFTYYTLRPRTAYPRNFMMDSSVNGFGIVRLDSSDQGVGDLTKLVFKRAEQAQKADLSESDAKLLELFLKVVRQFVTSLVQTDNLIYLSYDPGVSNESALLVVPLRNRLSYVLAQRFMKGNLGMPADTIGGAEVYSFGATESGTTRSVVSLSGRDVVYSDNPAFLRRSLEYAAQPDRLVETPDRLQQYIDELGLDQPPAGEDFALAIVNEEGRLENLLKLLERQMGISGLAEKLEATMAAEKVSLSELLGCKVTADLVSADKAKGEFVFYCRQSDVANRLANVFKQGLVHITGKRNGSITEVKADVRTRGTSVVVGAEVSGLKHWVETMLPVPRPPEAAAATPAAP